MSKFEAERVVERLIALSDVLVRTNIVGGYTICREAANLITTAILDNMKETDVKQERPYSGPVIRPEDIELI